jgi:hypothetical protein
MQNTERLTSGTNNADLVPVAFWMAVRMSSSVRSSHGSTSCKIDQIARDTQSISDCKPALHSSYQNRIQLSTYGIKLPHSWTIILFNKMVRGPLRLQLKSSGYLKLQLFKEMRMPCQVNNSKNNNNNNNNNNNSKSNFNSNNIKVAEF